MDFSKQGKPLNRQTKTIVINIYKEMLKGGYPYGGMRPEVSARKRTAKLAGVSDKTVYRMVKEFNESGTVKSPKKKTTHRSWVTDINSSDLKAIRRIIYEHHISDYQVITLASLSQKLNDDLGFKISRTSLWRLLKSKGFRFFQTENRTTILCEREDVKISRIKYIRSVREFREKGYQIIYIGEIFIENLRSKASLPTDKGLSKPSGKGYRLIIAHAGGSKGFVKDGLLMLEPGSSSGDYRNEIHFENFSKWIETLLGHIEGPSVIVMDDSAYNKKFKDKDPTALSKKEDLINWLKEKNIEHSSTMFKIELFDLVRQNKTSPKQLIDEKIRSAGHEVLRLPANHGDLNPIEHLLEIIKARVSVRNKTFTLDDTTLLTEEEVQKITIGDWEKMCDKVIKTENNYIRYETNWDTFTEKITIKPGQDSSSELCSLDDTNSSSDDEESK